jgi:hypothetical protein
MKKKQLLTQFGGKVSWIFLSINLEGKDFRPSLKSKFGAHQNHSHGAEDDLKERRG